jgi:hypothetical protein
MALLPLFFPAVFHLAPSTRFVVPSLFGVVNLIWCMHDFEICLFEMEFSKCKNSFSRFSFCRGEFGQAQFWAVKHVVDVVLHHAGSAALLTTRGHE